MTRSDPFGALAELSPGIAYHRLDRLGDLGLVDLDRLPITVRVLLENLLRHAGGPYVTEDDVRALCAWDPTAARRLWELPFLPARVLLQDLTGVPSVVDLAALRSAAARAGVDPMTIDTVVPADLVVDHSVQADAFGSPRAYAVNVEHEFERNHERYALLRWAQQAFRGFRVVPPGMGIVHQVNLEYLAPVVQVRDDGAGLVACPDTVVGTDSHTTMINGIGVLGWGVGGIEAEAAMMGQPLPLHLPVVVGVRMRGTLPAGTTATDLVLTLTQQLRGHGVVDKFVEFYGPGLGSMTAADRATLSNMAPEYGATAALFPVDGRTLQYLRDSGRDPEHVDLVERYLRVQRLFHADGLPEPAFNETVEVDLSSVVPSMAGPRRPQDRVSLPDVWRSFMDAHGESPGGGMEPPVAPPANGFAPDVGWARDRDAGGATGGAGMEESARAATAAGTAGRAPQGPAPATGTGPPGDGPGAALGNGSVVIAAITSCTNTSNPALMIGAGLLARRAVDRGLRVPAYVKTTLAPGSRVVSDYLERAGLLQPLSALGFDLVGYGCTTCIGNSGPLASGVAEHVERGDLAVAAVLSGNRNFEGRIHPLVKASYLASPALVVAYALAGTVRRDLTIEPVAVTPGGSPVYLRELWPSTSEVQEAMAAAVGRDLFTLEYSHAFEGDTLWQALPAPTGALYTWDPESTYVLEPPFLSGEMRGDGHVRVSTTGAPPTAPSAAAGVAIEIEGARALVVLGDTITTDHISPAGAISPRSPAGVYLIEHGVRPADFNSYGARRGNHEVMMRGTFANPRLRNRLCTAEGWFTTHLDSGEETTIHDAAMRYAAAGVPLIVIAGRDYGSGSSRDWAAKGPRLLGVRAVIAESFERIHRSNLVGMGILPLQFENGDTAESLGLTGRERYNIYGRATAGQNGRLSVVATPDAGIPIAFEVLCRIAGVNELRWLAAGGLLPLLVDELTA